MFALSLCGIVQPPPAAAQTTPTQPAAAELQSAAGLFDKADWKGTLDAYSALGAKYPTHALTRLRIGVALLELGRPTEAETNFREAERLGTPVSEAAFRLAQALADQRRDDAAIAELLRAANNGRVQPLATLGDNARFAALRTHRQWPTVLNAFDAVLRPCMHDPRFREFDFWVGEWDVRVRGAPAVGEPARNTITIENNGCVILERWKAPSGSEGQSFNIFDRSYGVWRQTWVDNQGGQHDYRGGIKDGNMVYEGDTPMPGGRPGRVPTRLTFFRIGPDTVRQFSQVSADSGKTWTTAYDLIYVRRKPNLP